MNTLALRPLRWQLGAIVLLALLCALGSGLGLTFQSPNLATLQISPRPLPPLPSTPDTSKAFQILKEERKQVTFEIEQLEGRDLPSIETQIKQSKQLAESTDSPELKALEDLRKKTPRWDDLDFNRQRPQDLEVIEVWISPEITDKQVGHVVSVLKARRDAYTQQAASGVKNRTDTEKQLSSLRDKLVTDRETLLSTLVIDALGEAEITTLLAKIKELFSGGIRAVAGENFTNSIGMEMVWIRDGGFWIGRTEVTSSAYKAITGSGNGGNNPVEGISWDRAHNFCQLLTDKEENPPGQIPPEMKLRPADALYGLPGVKQWRKARDAAEALGMSGFSDGLSEWSSDTHRSGLSQNTSFTQGVNVPIQSDWALALNGNTVQPLPGVLTGSWVQSGKDRIVIWQGRLGFRVILIPTSP